MNKKTISIMLFILALSAAFANGQTPVVRWDWNAQTINSSSPQPGGMYPVLALPNVQVSLCSGTPCTAITTYTDSTGTTACTTTSQLTRSGSGICYANTDQEGGFGAWVAPGCYKYQITSPYGTFGPYDFCAGDGGVGGSGSPGGTNGQIQYNNNGDFGGLSNVPISQGGTGANTAQGAANNIINGNSISPTTVTASGDVNANTFAGAAPGQIRPPVGPSVLDKTWSAYHAFGDSITFGYGSTGGSCSANPTPLCYARRIAQATNTTLSNYAVAGDEACDMVNHVLNSDLPVAGDHILRTVMIGTNDSTNHSATYMEPSDACYNAALVWLGTTTKTMGNNTTTIPDGWSLDNTYAQATGLQSTTNGATFTVPVTITYQAQQVWVFYRIIDGNGGVFEAKLDGGGQDIYVYDYTNAPISTLNGATEAVAAQNMSGLGVMPGVHNLTITVNSATDPGKIVSILAIAVAPDTKSDDNPIVFAAGPPRAGAYTQGEMGEAFTPATLNYWNQYANIVSGLERSGLQVWWTPVRSHWLSQPDYMADYLHPNDAGHEQIAEAFEGPSETVDVPTYPTVGNFDQGQPYTQYLDNSSACPYQMSKTDGLVIVAGSSTANCYVYLPSGPSQPERKRLEIANISSGRVYVPNVDTYLMNKDTMTLEWAHSSWDKIAVGRTNNNYFAGFGTGGFFAGPYYPFPGGSADGYFSAIRAKVDGVYQGDLYVARGTGDPSGTKCWSGSIQADYDDQPSNRYGGLVFRAPLNPLGDTCGSETWNTVGRWTSYALNSLVPIMAPSYTNPTFTGTITTPITGSTQCLHVDSSGVVTGTGSDCGTGGGGSGTVTTFTAPSGSWPSWLVPTVTNATTTPNLAVAASTIPITAGGTGNTTAAAALAALLGNPTGGVNYAVTCSSSTSCTASPGPAVMKISSGVAVLGTSAIASGACATTVTVAAASVLTTDTIKYTPNTDPTAVTGYGPSASGSLYIWAWPTAGNVNFKVCNNTGSSITPGALTLNWEVAR